MNSDLIIIVNANRNILNIPLLLLSKLGFLKVALWGHGRSYQANDKSLLEKLKRKVAVMPYWWFSYTDNVSEYLVSIGFNRKKITCIDNAIDTESFASELQAVTDNELNSMRENLGIRMGDRVAIYCGSLYPEKRVPFLLGASKLIHEQDPRFKLIVIGSGVEAKLVMESEEMSDHIRYTGALFGKDKLICYRLAEIVCNPGLVGLAILDSFAAGLPIITMSDSLHSPEIAYLEHNHNGLLVSGGMSEYAKSCLRLIKDDNFRQHLSIGASASAKKYTVNNMVNKIRVGVASCLHVTKDTEGR